MDPVERIQRATAVAAEKVKGVAVDQLSGPTPCAEFDVRALLNHVIGGLAMLSTAARGEKGAMPEGDQFGSDPGADYDRLRGELIAAISVDGVLERDWEMPFATMPGAVMANIAFMEHLTHAWDVAKATGQDPTLPADLVTECLQVATPMDAMLRTPGVCGPALAVADGASDQDRLIAFLGREP